MAFQPGIPTGLVDLDQDFQNLQNNFQQLDIIFGIDHTLFSNATAQRGYHKNIHLIPVSTVASNPPNNQPINGTVAVAGFGQVLNAQINDGINTDTAMFFLSGGNRLTQLTRNFVPSNAANGYTCLPGGIIMQWGLSGTPAGSGSFNVPLNIPFPRNFYCALATYNQATATDRFVGTETAPTAGVVNSINFRILVGGRPFYWLAFGN